MNNITIVEEAAQSSKGNHAPIPTTKTQSWQQKERKKSYTGSDVALDYNDSDTSSHNGEQLAVRRKKRKKQSTEKQAEEDDRVRLIVDPEKSTNERSLCHIKTLSRKKGSPQILSCNGNNGNNGNKDSTTGKHDGGSSSQTGSHSTSSSSNRNSASASGCGGSGGRDDDENKNNYISSESSTEDECSDNEQASKDVQKKVFGFTVRKQ